MTATSYAPRDRTSAPQPRPPRPAPVAPPPPHLRLVDPKAARERRRAQLVTWVLLVAACAGLFAIVALRVLLAQGQVHVDRLEASIEEAQAVHQDLRLTVAELEAPAQIVAAARQRLGMVTPVTVAYLTPPPASAR